MEEKKFLAAKVIYDKAERIKTQLSDLNLLLSVIEHRSDLGNTENIDLKYQVNWKGQTIMVQVPEELYITALQMVNKNYMDKLTELDKDFKKV